MAILVLFISLHAVPYASEKTSVKIRLLSCYSKILSCCCDAWKMLTETRRSINIEC